MKHLILTLQIILMCAACAEAQTAGPVHSESTYASLSCTTYADINVDSSLEAPSPTTHTATHTGFNYKRTTEWHRYTALRAVGWASLGVGIPTTFFGLILCGLSSIYGGNVEGLFLGIAITGGVLTVASIPILISAYHYRNKARRMSLDIGMSQIALPALAVCKHSPTPAISFKLTF